MNGKIGNIIKRENSTKNEFVSIDIVLNLKDTSSIINPVVIIDTSVNAYGYNYLYINQFSRFYFIRDCKWVLGAWELTCECDVLASWKTQITSAEKYVLRSSSNYDTSITDTLYPSKASAYLKHSQATLPIGQAESFIISTICESPYAFGSTTYYVCTRQQAKDFMGFMLSGVPTWENISDFSGDVAKAFIDPFQYVTGCMVFPFLIPDTITTDGTIKFGYWDSGISAKILLTPKRFFNVELTLPASDDTRVFTNYQPYAEYWLEAGVFGVVPLNRKWFETNKVYVNVAVDLMNGNSKLTVSNTSDIDVNPLTVSVSKIGSQVAIASTQFRSELGIGGGIESVLAPVATGLSSLVSGGNVMSSALNSLVKTQVSGQNEGVVAAQDSAVITLVGLFYNMADEDITENGRPCFKRVTLSTLTGYCKVDDGRIAGNMLLEEQRKIQAYLEGGFFIE